jgi:hypothetical protein
MVSDSVPVPLQARVNFSLKEVQNLETLKAVCSNPWVEAILVSTKFLFLFVTLEGNFFFKYLTINWPA